MSDEITVTPKITTPVKVDKITPADEAPVSSPLSGTENAVVKMELAQHLGVKDMSDEKLKFVYEQLSKNGVSKGDLFASLRNLEVKLGLPRYGLGENNLGRVYNYLRAEYTVEQASKVRNSYLA